MSRKGVLIAMIVALAMAAAAWFLLGPKSSSTGATPETAPAARFFTFAPSDVRALEITYPDGRVERLERDGQIWRLIIPARQDAAPDAWPVAPAQMRGLLDVVTRLAPVAPAQGRSFSGDPLLFVIELQTAERATLRLDPTAVGGRRLAQVNDQPPAYIDQPLYEALTIPGPRGWREKQLFEGIGAETARVEIESDQGEVSLARVRDDWFMRAPVRAPADAAAVDRLLNHLAALAVSRWIDTDLENESAASSAGVSRIAIERDHKIFGDSGADVRTDRREAIFAGAANLGGGERLVYVGAGRNSGAIAAATVSNINTDPAAYISRKAVTLTGSQVGALRITTLESGERINIVSRTLDGWSISGDSGPTRAIASAPVHKFLTLLTNQLATRISLELPESAAPIAHVEALDFDGGPLEAVIVFALEDGVVIQTGDVFRRYDGVAIPSLLTDNRESDAPTGVISDEPIK